MAWLRLLQRAWMLVLQCALVLPFVVTKDCTTGVTSTYTGLEVYLGDGRAGLMVVLLAIVAVLVAAPWSGGRTSRDGAALGLRAWVAGLGAALAVAAPGLAFLFDSNEPLVGWWLHGGGWVATFLAYLGLAAAALGPRTDARVPERFAVIALLCAPPLAVALKSVLDPGPPGEILAGGLVGYALATPLALAGLALVRALGQGLPVRDLRALWWVATMATLLGHLSAGLGK